MAVRGGKREGAGRKPSKNPAKKAVSIKMTIDQHKKFLLLGGSKWIKKIIDATRLQITPEKD